MESKMKLVLTGYAQHGKDTACLYLVAKYGFEFVSSSLFVAEKAVRPYLEGKGIKYPTIEECYQDRMNHRAKWFNAISEYNTPDKSRLGRELFEKYDLYCGLRSYAELAALKKEKAFDYSIWIDRSRVMPREPDTSITITPYDCDYILDNGGTLDHLYENIDRLIKHLNHHYRVNHKEK